MSGKDESNERGSPARTPRRRSRLWRVVKWALAVLFALLIGLSGLTAWVLGTSSGTAFAWWAVRGHLPADLQVAAVHGRLIGPLEIRGVTYRDKSMSAHVAAIDFGMDFGALLHGTLHIRHLDLDGVHYKARKTAAPSAKQSGGGFALPKSMVLPLKVRVDRITLIDVTTVTSPGAQPVRVNRMQLRGARLDKRHWRIDSLTGRGPRFDLDARASLKPGGGYPLNLHAKTTLRLPNYAPIEAQADISGPLADLDISADIKAPYNLSLKGHIRHALTLPVIDATMHARDLKTHAISATLPVVRTDADIRANGPIDKLALDVSGDVNSADYGKATVDGKLRYTPQAVAIDHLRLGIPATGGTLDASGHVALASARTMQLSVHWSHLAWPLSGTPAYTSDEGEVQLNGTLADYTLETHLDWQVAGQAAGHLAVAGSGTMQSFDLKSFKASGGPGDIHGHGQLQWSPQLHVTAHLAGEHINPGAIVAKLPGDFALKADVSVGSGSQGYNAQIKQLTAHGSLRHQPLDVHARLDYQGDHVVIHRFDLKSGSATAHATGRFGWTPGARLDGRWSMDAAHLSTILPGLHGRLSSQGQVTGSFDAPDIKATLSGHDLAGYGYQAKRANVDADVDWSGHTKSKVAVALDDLKAAGRSIHQLALHAHGTPGSHDLTLKLDGTQTRLDAALTGSFNRSARREKFTLRRLKAGYGELAPWQLASPASGTVTANAQSIDKACLTSGSARVCLSGHHGAQGSAGHVALSNVPYAYAKPYFPSGLSVNGAISGQIDAKLATGGRPAADVDLNTTGGRVQMTPEGGPSVQVLDLKPGHIRAHVADNGVTADLALPLAGSDGIQAHASVAKGAGSLWTHTLDGRLHVGLASMKFLSKLSPEVDTFDGHFAGDMQLGGTPAQPSIRGKIGLDASKIVLVTPGVTVTDVHFGAQGQGSRILLNGAAHSGGGALNAKGDIALQKNGQTVHLSLTGKNFQMAHIPDVTAYVSPELKIAVTPSRVDVNGQVTIPKASITPRNLPASGVQTASPDQQIVTQSSSGSKAVARAIHANVKVVLGKKVHFSGFGLKSDLEGAVRVVQQPGNEPTATGAIQLKKGSYRAYGQNLDIQNGKILFAGGPVSQPGIELKAARYPQKDVTVGVKVRGSVRNPQLTLFSDPNMSQSEQLSWLLLGRSLNSASGKQSSMVARAALALGSSRGNAVLKKVGDKLGLDEIGVGSAAGKSSSEAAFTVGKYLSPKLYVGYGLGLFDQVSTVTMRYTLSSHWKLETQSSSEATGGDVIWTFDR